MYKVNTRRSKITEKIFKVIMKDNFPKLMINNKPQIPEDL